MSSWAKKWNLVYVEEAVWDHPRTQSILAKFPKSQILKIESYKNVFHKPGQVFQTQKNSPKWILAEKKDNFLYDGSPYAPNFSHPNFYYNNLVMNCLYNCDYCYLQGMYSSANIVTFVNQEDFFSATQQKLKELGSLYLCLSYDTDLLAFEQILGYCRDWIQFARDKPNLLLELRTKSVNFTSLKDIPVLPNMILAWTLSPDSVVKHYEPLTPSLSGRIQQIRLAQELGWKVRICLDPILHIPTWKTDMESLVGEIQSQVIPERIQDISLGVFRIQKDFLKSMKRGGQDSAIVHYPFETKNGIATYPLDVRQEMQDFLQTLLAKWIPSSKIHFLRVESL